MKKPLPPRRDPIWFVGGAHGTGKSTLCALIADRLGATHVVASKLLGYRAERNDPTQKRVRDLLASQARIARHLETLPLTGDPIVLDGHYALLNGVGDIVRVPVDTFAAIRPASMILLEAPPSAVQSRIGARDKVTIPLPLLASLMTAERENARLVSGILGVPLLTVWDPPDVDEIARFLLGRASRTHA